MSSSTPIPLYSLLSVCVTLSLEACEVIRSVLATGDLKAKDKGAVPTKSSSPPSSVTDFNDPQTVADLESQILITSNLRHVFGPALRVIGEEDPNDLQQYLSHSSRMPHDRLLIQYRSLQNAFSTSILKHPLIDSLTSSFLSHLTNTHYPASSVTVWVDPLDGTKEFTIGLYSSVTVLVGISVDGKAVAGVVAVPMKDADGKDFYVGVNGVGSFAFTKTTSKDEQKDISYDGASFRAVPLDSHAVLTSIDSKMSNRRVIATSRSHFSPHIASLLDSLKSTDVIRNGGAGSKTIMVIEGVADAYVFPSLGTKKWDTCACEAIIGGMLGGTMTDCFGDRIEYDGNAKDYMNYKGVVCSLRGQETFLFSKDVKMEDGKKKEKDAQGSNKL